MNVRKVSKTTFSLIVLIVGLIYLLPVIRYALLYGEFYTLGNRLYELYYLGGYYLGGYYPFIVNAAIWIMIVAGMLDVIMRNKVAFDVLSSLNIPITVSIPVIIAALFPSVDLIMFWGILQLAVILGIYGTFRKIIRNNHTNGQKMTPFIKKIKTAGGRPNGHIYDHYVVFGTSLLLLAVYALLVLSFLIYVATHWQAFV